MSIIEQAARRLEELRRSGIEVPAIKSAPSAPVPLRDGPVEQRQGAQVEPLRARLGPADSANHRSKRVEIDLTRLSSLGYITPTEPRARIADEFRVIKRPLLSNVSSGSSGRANLVMVTSSLAGEGKTFVAVNLAISIAAEMDRTVLLVDADVSRPSVMSRLGLPMAKGLLDLLVEPALGVSDVLLRTNIEKLALIPSGSPRGHATELLASHTMSSLLDELAARYPDRVIVFDAPPLLPSTESRVLATGMGQVVVVVEADRTPQSAVQQALATLESCPVVLPLLNKTRQSEVGAYYGYYMASPD